MGVNTQVQEQKAPYSSIPGKLVCGPRTQQLIDQGLLEEFPVHIVELLLEIPAYGLNFLEDFLTIAQIEPETDKTSACFAFCCVQNVRELAQTMGWGYDTAHKYVILFCALGLLQKYRYRHKVILQFPLRGYVFPNSLEELEKLIGKSRSRVQSLAARVKARCIELQIINQDLSSSQSTKPSMEVETQKSRPQTDATHINYTHPIQNHMHTSKHITYEGETNTDVFTLQNHQNSLDKDLEEAALLREMHKYTTECAREQRQSTVAHRSDLFAALVTQFLLNDKSCYERYAPQLSAGEILHLSIVENKKNGESSTQDEILATCDIYPHYFEPGFPINRYAWEYLGYAPQFENSMYADNRQNYHLDFFEISRHYAPGQPQPDNTTNSITIPPQDVSSAISTQETESSNTLVQKAEIAPSATSPNAENDPVLYEEIVVPANMPRLRERWLAEGRIVELLDPNGRLKTYKIRKEQTEQIQHEQTYNQADEQTMAPPRNKRRKRQIYTQDCFQVDENEQAHQIEPASYQIETARQMPRSEQRDSIRPFSQKSKLTPIANHISAITQTIRSQQETKYLEQEQSTFDQQTLVSKQKKSPLPHSMVESSKSVQLSPIVQPSNQISLTKNEDAPETKGLLSEHLIPLEYWDREVIAEYERAYKSVPGDKLDFSYDDLKRFQTIYKTFPSAETFLEIDAYRDWYSADFDEDFLHAYNTLNVITFIKYIINNKNNIQKRNTFITFLISIFDKNCIQKEKSASYYYQLFKNDYHPDVISCALLSTLLAMYSKGRETMERPGAIFIKSCQTLQKKVNEQGQISYSDLKAARKFGNFTFADLAIALHDNLVLDGATERLSIYLAVTFATNSCYRSQNNFEESPSSQQNKPKQEKVSVSNNTHDQIDFQAPERRVS